MNPSDEPQELLEEPEIAEENPQPDPRKKWILFASGFFGWHVINTVFWLLITPGPKSPNEFVYVYLPNLLILPANIILLIVLAAIRPTRWMALGILAALALNFLISLILGLNTNAVCFVPFLVK